MTEAQINNSRKYLSSRIGKFSNWDNWLYKKETESLNYDLELWLKETFPDYSYVSSQFCGGVDDDEEAYCVIAVLEKALEVFTTTFLVGNNYHYTNTTHTSAVPMLMDHMKKLH